MKKLLPLLILALGVVISASYGARLGDQHSQYRVAQAAVDKAADDAARASAIEARDAIGLPSPSDRLTAWFAEGGIGWLLGSGLILAGALIARKQQQDAQSGGDGGGAEADFPGTVAEALRVIARLEGLLAELAMDGDSPEARDAIDKLADLKLGPLVDARGQLIAKHGLATFAEYFGPFSGGERNLARVWSAITDGHAEEARASLAAARSNFEQAQQQWDAVEARAA